MADSLVVVSKVKKHVKDAHGMRTSEEAIECLTQVVIGKLVEAAEKAKADKRKTIQGRDF